MSQRHTAKSGDLFFNDYYDAPLNYDLGPPLNEREKQVARRIERRVIAQSDASWSYGLWAFFICFIFFIFLVLILAPVFRYHPTAHSSTSYHAPPPTYSYSQNSYGHPQPTAYPPPPASGLTVLLLVGFGVCGVLILLAALGGCYWYSQPVVVVKKRDSDSDTETPAAAAQQV